MEVFRYLVDVRDWPLAADDIEDDDLDAVTYDWDADDLGIPAGALRDLRELRQMRPLTAGQPWGVFFLKFGGERLPKVQIRRLLRALVAKKRTAAAASRPTWRLSDLLFIVFTGSGDSIEVHFVAFRGDDPQSAELRELSWQPALDTRLVLELLAEERLPCLDWPDDEDDVESWRNRWRSGLTPVGQAISDSARLADRMARTARDLRTQIEAALGAEGGSGPFSTLMGEIRAQLVSDVNKSSFADMCAQTLVYGVLTSRMISDDFGSSPVFSSVPLANPFLAKFFQRVHDRAMSLDLPGSDLANLVADLRETDVKAILARFGSTAKGGDPVIHFYEEFLKKYDPKMRADAGAFYTPQPAVEFMVRAVDEVLRSRFGLPLGVADATSWREVAERNGFEVPKGVDPDKPFVSMVDPATGTGTFLVEWLRQARRSFDESREAGEWPQHVRENVLPSMHAFELMLAPYAIAHLKVALELDEAAAKGSTAQILLTDALDHAARQGQLVTVLDPVAEEGQKAAELKADERFTVVIGNPPYDREQRSTGDVGRRKGGVVRYGAAGVAPTHDSETAFRRAATGRTTRTARITPLLDSVAEPMKAAGLGHHLKNVYNDYVYFWRWAVWQATELPPGPGVVAFITASSYLDGISMGGVRHLLRNAFDELWIVDLGGEGRGARQEENIFDIRTAVAIGIGVRTGQTNINGCAVRYLRVGGTRDDKLEELRRIKLDEVSSTIAGSSLERLTPHSGGKYFDWPEITHLFPWIYSGCQIKRLWPVAETKAALKGRWRSLLTEVPRHRRELLRETGSRKTKSILAGLLGDGARLRPIRALGSGDPPEAIKRYGYRSFDRQWIIADIRVVDAPKRPLWDAHGPHQTFLTTLTSTKLGGGPALTATPYVPDLHHFRGSYGAKDVMPLHRDTAGREPNVADGLLDTLSENLATDVTADDLFAYVYALGATAAFTERFNEELAEAAGPIHIPVTAKSDLFQQAVALGRDLLWWHTWGERFAPEGQPRLPEGHAKELRPVEGMPDDFDYDPESQTLTVGTGAFAPVSEAAWNFEVSGLRVLRSWLGYRMKNRKGRKSSPLDDLRPTRWTQTKELLLVLSIIEHTIEATPKAAALLTQIVQGPLIPAIDLSTPTPANRKPPKIS